MKEDYNKYCACGKVAKYIAPFPTEEGMIEQPCCEECCPKDKLEMIKSHGKVTFHNF